VLFLLNFITFIIPGFYYTNTQSFPKRLSSKEENEYLRKFKEGDKEAKNILIERNLRLVAHIVKKYNSPDRDMDDLISIGTIGLIKAIMTYNVDKGTRLGTYASRCIENEILMMLRNEKKHNKEVSLQEPIGIDKEGNEISLIDIMETEDESIIEQVDLTMKIRQLYEKIKSTLKSRERMVLELRYGLYNGSSKTQQEIASMLGISRSYVSRIEKKAINKLKKTMANNK
jgi:RNA polymerase sporulation-specific sigma factor